MDSIHVLGGTRLQGKVRIQGSKNAVLPILAGTLLTNDICFLKECPKIADVYKMISILKSLGCRISWEKDGLSVDATHVSCGRMPSEAITGMRSSLCLLGALLAKGSEVIMEHPGGCVIGARPIDLHVQALSLMGVEFYEENGKVRACTKGISGTEIVLPFPSVGATENIVLAATLAKGTTMIKGAAVEPEVEALCRFLVGCGAKIQGISTTTLTIMGQQTLHGGVFEIPADRIVAGTYLFATVAAGGNVFLERAPASQMYAVLRAAQEMGAVCSITEEGIYIQKMSKPGRFPFLQTAVYPGFPTDLQSLVLVCRCIGKGRSLVVEKIFENRFRIVEELQKMGAEITVLDEHSVEVNGVERLRGAQIQAQELRGGAALVVAGLVAEGETCVKGCSYIYRGYENICKDLQELGARIISV